MPAVYRPRDPRKTPLFQLLESLYEAVKLAWEERFEARYGFWQGSWDEAVAHYLDCGIWNAGFARVGCDSTPSRPAGAGHATTASSRSPT